MTDDGNQKSESLNKRLRKLFQPGNGTMMVGAGNALTARIATQVGFEAVHVSGAAISNFTYGLPDLGLTTFNDLLHHVTMMRDVIEVPLFVDADTGYGGPLNVRRTVRHLERAGANAIMLEDQVTPKRCGHFEGKEVISKAEMIQKIKAAVDARTDDDLIIFARTDARAVHGLDDALDRAAAYQEAGADCLFVEAPTTLEELARIPRAVPAPHLANMVHGGRTPIQNREQLAALGYACVVCANALLQAAMKAMVSMAEHIRKHGTLEGGEAHMVSFSERQERVDYKLYEQLARRYQTPR